MSASDPVWPDNLIRLETIRLDQLRGRDVSQDIVILPLAPIENHGTHLPAGTDIYITDDLALRMGRKFAERHPGTRVLLYPTISVGAATIRGTGSFKVSSRQLRNSLRFLSKRFFKQGYRRYVFVSGHGGVGHIGALDSACAYLRGKGAEAIAPCASAVMKAYRGLYIPHCRETGVAWPDNLEFLFSNDLHAGWIETSMMLRLRPDLVSPDFTSVPPLFAKKFWWLSGLERFIVAVAGRLPISEETKAQVAIGAHVGALDLSWIIQGRLDGYHGAPALASAEAGEVILDVVTTDMAESMEHVFVHETQGVHGPSSAYLFKRLGWAVASLILIASVLAWIAMETGAP
ncbi:MAG: creatininase family protein [Deltaproteobacteria bacterium]|nr:creatininase family protein [Deltaproteobacteria bacterium]MCB9487123.1 creatininase family protein [Deltaproteobacteria bacterium]